MISYIEVCHKRILDTFILSQMVTVVTTLVLVSITPGQFKGLDLLHGILVEFLLLYTHYKFLTIKS